MPNAERSIESQSSEKIIVVGAGVMGLTSAIELQKAGYQVEIWAKEIPGAVSKVASFWEPFASEPDKRGRDPQWGKDTFDTLQAQTKAGVPGLAVFPGMTMFPGERDAPDWSKYIPSFQHITDPQDLRETGQAMGINVPPHARSGYTVKYPTFDMPKYLPYLIAEFEARGGIIHQKTVSEGLEEPLNHADIVINCTGVASRELVADKLVRGMRGQLVEVTRPAGVNVLAIDDEYPNPHGEGTVMRNVMLHEDHVMLGGTAEDSIDTTPSELEAQRILQRCIDLVPALKDCRVIANHVGIRPYRKGIRLEAEDTQLPASNGKGTKHVVHNYGHGGSGVTFSWGCGMEVVREVEAIRRSRSL